MKKLTKLTQKLRSRDLKLICNIYSAKENDNEGKRLQLLELIINEQITDDEEAAMRIYGRKPDAAFSKLKQRLREDMLNFLLMQDTDRLFESTVGRAKFDCKRKLLMGEFLIHRGAIEEGQRLLRKALNMAQKYELFGEVLQIRDLLRSKAGDASGLNAYELYTQQIEKDFKSYQEILRAKALYGRLTLPHHFIINMDKDYEVYGKEILETFRIREESSQTCKFFYYMAAHYYYSLIHNYEKSLAINQQFEALLKPGGIFNNKAYLAICQNNYASIYINLRDYEKSQLHAQKALELFNIKKGNWEKGARQIFLASFLNKDFEKAENIIEEALQNKIVGGNVLVKGKWNYFKAILEFEKGNLDEARANLYNMGKLPNIDPSGWLIGYKLLEIMILIIEKEYSLIYIHLNNFNLLLHRHKTANITRAKTILKVLKAYNKYPFDKKQLKTKVAKEMALLKEGKNEYFWTPLGFEVVRFDQWFEDNILNQVAMVIR